MKMTLIIAIGIAVYWWLINIDFGTLSAIFLLSPTINGLIFGLFFGNPTQGLIIGATINLMFVSVNSVGGNLPNDPSLAACVAIPIALMTNMDPSVAVVLAVPFGVLGGFIDNLRRVVNGRLVPVAIKCVEKGDINGIGRVNVLYSALIQFVLRVPIMTVIMMIVGNGISSTLDIVPAWVMNGFSVAGSILQGVGVMLCAVYVGRKELAPFMLIGFYMMYVGNTSMTVITIIAFAVALLFVQLKFPKKAVDDDDEEEEEVDAIASRKPMLDNKLLTRVGMRLPLLFRFNNNFENFFGTGTCHGMLPALKVIYKDDPEGLKDACKRHLQPFITEVTCGHAIIGAALAMEEEKELGGDVSGEDISTLKSSLMGPFAGFGDSLFNGTFASILRTIFVPFGVAGNAIGCLGEIIYRGVGYVISVITFKLGYTKGRGALVKILRGGIMEKIMTGAAVLGMIMLGALGASYCSISTPLQIITNSGDTYVIQEFLDGLLPGILPLLTLGGCYAYLSKGGKYIKLILAIMAVALLGSLVGIL